MASQQQTPPPPPPRIFNKFVVRYAPLNLLRNMIFFPDNYPNLLPKFNGEDYITTLENLSSFDNFTDNLGLEHEDVYMRICVQTFEGEVRTWFKGLPLHSIDSWDELEFIFFKQWNKRNDNLYYLTDFGSLRKKHNESLPDFIKIFNKLYRKIPANVKPSQ